jgi:hypothetical protein
MVRARRPASGSTSTREAQERPDKAVQTSLRLSRAAYDQLSKAADHHGWGVGEEIRQRLETSFVQENQAVDDETNGLVQAIGNVVRNLEVPFGSWHKNRFAFDVFTEAVNALIELFRPKGDSVRPTDNEIADLYLGTAGTPETAGRMLAGGAAAGARILTPGARQRHRQTQAEGKR